MERLLASGAAHGGACVPGDGRARGVAGGSAGHSSMSATPVLPPARSGVALHARRCVRHTTREAAARCPACGEFFCRECVVEHAGKLLCAPCLAKSAVASEIRRKKLVRLRRAAQTVAGLLALWFAFYGLGALLLKVPPTVHDGTIWGAGAEDTAP